MIERRAGGAEQYREGCQISKPCVSNVQTGHIRASHNTIVSNKCPLNKQTNKQKNPYIIF